MLLLLLSGFSHVRLFATLWTVAHQAPLSMGFSRQEYWSGLPCPPPRDLPHPGIKLMSLMSPALAGKFFTTNATWETLLDLDLQFTPWKNRGWGLPLSRLLTPKEKKDWTTYITQFLLPNPPNKEIIVPESRGQEAYAFGNLGITKWGPFIWKLETK